MNDAATMGTFPLVFDTKKEDATTKIGFTVDEVTARGGYLIRLDVKDKADYMTSQSIEFDFRTDYCLSLFDAETEMAYV